MQKYSCNGAEWLISIILTNKNFARRVAAKRRESQIFPIAYRPNGAKGRLSANLQPLGAGVALVVEGEELVRIALDAIDLDGTLGAQDNEFTLLFELLN